LLAGSDRKLAAPLNAVKLGVTISISARRINVHDAPVCLYTRPTWSVGTR